MAFSLHRLFVSPPLAWDLWVLPLGRFLLTVAPLVDPGGPAPPLGFSWAWGGPFGGFPFALAGAPLWPPASFPASCLLRRACWAAAPGLGPLGPPGPWPGTFGSPPLCCSCMRTRTSEASSGASTNAQFEKPDSCRQSCCDVYAGHRLAGPCRSRRALLRYLRVVASQPTQTRRLLRPS